MKYLLLVIMLHVSFWAVAQSKKTFDFYKTPYIVWEDTCKNGNTVQISFNASTNDVLKIKSLDQMDHYVFLDGVYHFVAAGTELEKTLQFNKTYNLSVNNNISSDNKVFRIGLSLIGIRIKQINKKSTTVKKIPS